MLKLARNSSTSSSPFLPCLSQLSISSLLKQFQVMEIGALEEKVVWAKMRWVRHSFFLCMIYTYIYIYIYIFFFSLFNFLFFRFGEFYRISKQRIIFVATRILIPKHDIINFLFR